MLDSESGYVNDEETAYLILEPIQGEGGYRFPSDAYMTEIAAIADDHDIPVVVDEVQSGLGRTGEMWASDHYAIEPDVIASAKALRVGATIANEDMFPDQTSRLSSMWGAGDILSAAQGALTIDAIREYGLLENVTERGEQARALLRDAAMPGVTDVRGKGLMLAVEWEFKQLRNDVIEASLTRGLLTMGCGTKTMRLLPPLDVTEREIELGTSLLAAAAEASA